MPGRIPRISCAALLLVSAAAAQAQSPDWPKYTDAQRWERAAYMTTVMTVGAIAYAKAHGQTVEEFGQWWGEAFAPSWGQPGSYGPREVMRGMRRNFLVDPHAKVEILSESDSLVSARVSRPWVAHFGETGTLYGIALDEYDALYSLFVCAVAEYHGLTANVARAGEDIILTFSRR